MTTLCAERDALKTENAKLVLDRLHAMKERDDLKVSVAIREADINALKVELAKSRESNHAVAQLVIAANNDGLKAERHDLAMKVARKVYAHSFQDECGPLSDADERVIERLVAEVEVGQ